MQRPSDRWISIALSVLLHAALLGALVYGWLFLRQPPRPAPTLAIEATVVDARTLRGAQQAPPQAEPAPPAPEPAPVEPEGPPPPTPEELAQREQQAAAAAQAQQAAQERAAQQQAAEEEAAQAKRLEAQRDAAARAAQERKAKEAALAQQQAAAAQEASEREDLKRSLAAEEHARAVQAGPALASWQAQITAKIERAWLRPPTARPGIQCVLNVTQMPGGEVTQVSIGECNGDQAVRESIEAAVYRASPLPPPPDPSLFDRNLRINFKPD